MSPTTPRGEHRASRCSPTGTAPAATVASSRPAHHLDAAARCSSPHVMTVGTNDVTP